MVDTFLTLEVELLGLVAIHLVDFDDSKACCAPLAGKVSAVTATIVSSTVALRTGS